MIFFLKILEKVRVYGPIQFIKFFVRELIYLFWSQKIKSTYGQCGEDIIIDKYFKGKSRGFYIDIGANDPIRFNNTFRFYKKGWHGVNIEPNPDAFSELVRLRPGDINLNLGVGVKSGVMKFYKFDPDTLSTFSTKTAKKYMTDGFKVSKTLKVKVSPLATILKNLKIKHVDFMTIDTETYDLEVLRSNNWEKYKPKLICIETGERELKISKEIITNKDVINLLKKKGYKELYNTRVNTIFKKI